jgi:hypothetical protein
MRIRYEQAGGVAAPATNRRLDLDTATLPPDERREAAALVGAVESAGQAPTARPRRRDPDETSYRITLEDGGASRVLVFSDADVPTAVAPLLDWLRGRAR